MKSLQGASEFNPDVKVENLHKVVMNEGMENQLDKRVLVWIS